MGVVRKCPSCGGDLKAFASVCNACGHELSGIGANSTIDALVQKFAEIEESLDRAGFQGNVREKEITVRRARLIRDFPIPNSREDLQSLVAFIAPKIQPNIKPDPNAEDWRVKIKEVLTLAKLAYRDDSKSREYFEEIERGLNVSISAELKVGARRRPVLLALISAVVLLAVGGIAYSQYQQHQVAACKAKYAQDAAGENTRLETIATGVENKLLQKDYAGAQAAVGGLVWGVYSSCDGDLANGAKSEWEGRRQDLISRIEQAKASELAQKQALETEAARAEQARQQSELAAKQAEEARQASVKREAEVKAHAVREQKIEQDLDDSLSARAKAARQR